MASLKEDSLVFAEETKWDRRSEPDPNTSTLFALPDVAYAATQLDASPLMHKSPVHSGLDSLSPLMERLRMPLSPDGDTQVIGGRVNTRETRFASDTQVIRSAEPVAPETRPQYGDDTQRIVTDELQFKDTQVISAPRLTSRDRMNIAHLVDDTQVIPQPSLEQISTSSPKASPIVWGDTQPITQVVSLRPDAEKQVASSPEKYEVENTTFVLSPGAQQHRDEPTTQVVNTQEELTYDELRKVDLGCRPVFSSSQNDDKRSGNYSIISNDEIHTDDEDSIKMAYEDSIFQHKRRKLARQSASPSPEPADAPLPSPKVDIDVPSSTSVPHKSQWSQSQSSSELEDISHDVRDFDINALPGGSNDVSMAEAPDTKEAEEEVIIAPKRRRNQIPGTQSQDRPTLREEDLTGLTTDSIVNSNAVWAFSQFKLFPARLLQIGELLSYVEYSDYARLDTKNSDLFLLDLRIGDIVQVNLMSGEYVVSGMLSESDKSEFTCVRGFDTVILAKRGRHNVAQGKEFSVPLIEICMEISHWATHQLRFQLLADGVDLVQESYAVVQNVLRSLSVDSEDEGQAKRAESLKLSPRKLVADSGKPPISNIFSGVFFFATSMEAAKKEQLAELITTNGGLFIDGEIEQLIARRTDANGKLTLELTKFSGFKFGALISDGFSRSAKYLQALALGWPILAECFVEQVIADSLMLQSWHTFLLPAGQSRHTGIKSNDVFDFRVNHGKKKDMSEQLSNNAHLLKGHTILILDTKQDSKTLYVCEFIFHAFGAKRAKYITSVGAINDYLKDSHESVFVYDNGAKDYFKSHNKRTRRTKPKANRVGVIDWEWVVQCTISGHVWPPDMYVDV